MMEDLYDIQDSIIKDITRELAPNNILNNIRKKLDLRYNIAGGILIVADYYKKDIIFLRDGKEKPYPSFELKITKKSLSLDLKRKLPEKFDTHKFITRVFKLQRELKDSSDSRTKNIVFNKVPDYLNDKLFEKRDFHLITKLEMLDLFVIWRFCIWFISFKNNSIDNSLCIDDIYNYLLKTYTEDDILGKYYCDSRINSHANLNDSHLEKDIEKLDSKDSGFNLEEKKVWNEIRSKLDKIALSFNEELKKINETFNTNLTCDYVFTEIFEKNEIFEKINTIEDILNYCHDKNPVLISYFYFSVLGKDIKSHLILPVYRNKNYPVYFRTNNNFAKVNKGKSIVTYVCALNQDLTEKEVLELKGILKIASQDVLKAFYKSVVNHELSQDVYKSARNLVLCSIPPKENIDSNITKNIFQIGYYETNVTFLSQQTRAINLIKSLCDLGYIKKPLRTKDGHVLDSSIAIVGAGLSGITCFYALKYLGVSNVQLIEKNNELLNHLGRAKHRYIHPNIYNWPDKIFEENEAKLPFLKWKSGYTNEICNQIIFQFDMLIKDLKCKNQVRLGKSIKYVKRLKNGKFKLYSNDNRLVKNKEFDIVISCSGFSSEFEKIEHILNNKLENLKIEFANNDEFKKIELKPIQKSDFGVYWQPDNISSVFENETTIAIIGSGDGALIDLIRAKLISLNTGLPITQKEIMQLSNYKEIFDLGVILSELDREFQISKRIKNINLFEFYISHFTKDPEYSKSLEFAKFFLKKLLRDEVGVIHVSQSGRLSLSSALVNRTIAFILMNIENNKITDYTQNSFEYFGKKSLVVSSKTESGEKEFNLEKNVDYLSCRTGVFKNQYEVEKLKDEYKIKFNYEIKLDNENKDKKIKANSLESTLSDLNLTNQLSGDIISWFENNKNKYSNSGI